jgi:hypothetical protein
MTYSQYTLRLKTAPHRTSVRKPDRSVCSIDLDSDSQCRPIVGSGHHHRRKADSEYTGGSQRRPTKGLAGNLYCISVYRLCCGSVNQAAPASVI